MIELLIVLVPIALIAPVLLVAWANGEGDDKCHRCGKECGPDPDYYLARWCGVCDDWRTEWDGSQSAPGRYRNR